MLLFPKKLASARLAGLALLLLSTLPGTATPILESEETNLAKQVMHLLRDHCIRCHNSKKQKGDLDLTTRALAIKGGGDGPALLPDQSTESRMFQFLQPNNEPHMPPKKQLDAEQISAIGQWIDAGALWLPNELAIESKQLDPDALGQLPSGYQPVLALAISPDDRQLAAGHGNLIAIHNLKDESHSSTTKLTGHFDAVQSVAWSPDGRHLASGGFRRVLLWNSRDWSPKGKITDLPGRVTAMTFTSDSSILVTASNAPGQEAKITLWNVDGLAKQLNWLAHGEAVFDLAVAPGGKTLASAGADKLLRFWSLADGELLMQIEAHNAPVLSLAYKPDGTMIASGGADKELKVWDTKTREQKNLVTGHPGNVAAIAWPQKNAELITASDDGALRLCTETSKSPSNTWNKASDLLHCLAVTTDGQHLYGGADNGYIYTWNNNGKITGTIDPPTP